MNSMRKHRLTAAGFTLIELMVVILIMAIVLAFGVPSYRSFTTQDRMASEINDLSNDMELARSAAVKQGLNVTMCASAAPSATAPKCSNSTNWQTGWIVFTDVASMTAPTQAFGTYAAGDTVIRVHPALTSSDTLIGSATKSTLTSITFNRMGGTASLQSAGASAGTVSYGWLELKDSTANSAWTRCVFLSNAGTNSIDSASSNAGGTSGVCP